MSKIDRLQAQVKAASGRLALQREVGRSNVTRDPTYKAGCTLIDVSDFDEVIEVTDTHMICEPLVTMEQMTTAALAKGVVPQVVPEFRGITVGGAAMGVGIESSSHQFGQFNDTLEWCELVLGNGELVRASRTENSDLFDALPGSYGTLGIATRLCIRVVPAKPYVHLRAKRTNRLEWEPAIYQDGLAHHPGDYLLIHGDLANEPHGPLIHQRPWSRWFYQQAHEGEASMTLPDYLFRFDRGAFWMGRYLLHPAAFWSFLRRKELPPDKLAAILQTLQDRHPGLFFRTLFGGLMGSQSLYRGLHAMPGDVVKRSFLIQDSVLPLDNAEPFIDYIGEHHAPWPLWLCPLRHTERDQFLSYGSSIGGINIGTYGVSRMGDARIATRHLEQKLSELGGIKGLYGHSYYTPDEFWQLYDRPRYDALRAKYYAEGRFPSLEEKVLCG
jgi:Delta24-sterol reductase